ncbi:MAG: TRAP transporter small permease [Spirochaetia bacterium]|nr:TRAP transporter small permease [Spirochaetia bacterium]
MGRPWLRNAYNFIDRLRMVVIVAIFVFIISIGTLQIFMRYTPGINALSWVDEIMRYLNIWLVLLASSIGVKHGAHLRMDYFLNKLVSGWGIKLVRLLTELAVIFALFVLIYYGVIRTLDNLNTVIQALPVSIAWFYTAIPVGSFLMLMEFLLIFLNGGRHPYYSPANVCPDILDI